MHVEVVENNQSSKNSDKIERGLKRIVEVSGEGRKSRILSDAALATSLYGPVILFAEMMEDKLLAAKGGKSYVMHHLEKQAKKAPAKIEILNAEECSFRHIDGCVCYFNVSTS